MSLYENFNCTCNLLVVATGDGSVSMFVLCSEDELETSFFGLPGRRRGATGGWNTGSESDD